MFNIFFKKTKYESLISPKTNVALCGHEVLNPTFPIEYYDNSMQKIMNINLTKSALSRKRYTIFILLETLEEIDQILS